MKELLEIIRERRSLRVPFDPERPVPAEDLQQILEAARWTPTAHNMQNFEIIAVDNKETIAAIFGIHRPLSETFVRENYLQLSFSEDELLRKKTGLLGTMFPQSWRLPDFSLENLSESEKKAMQRPFPSAPLLLVVVFDPSKRAPASEGDFLGILSLGCAMENMWLTAQALGIGFHILSSLSAGTVQDEMKSILGIPGNFEIAFTCRLGYPLATPPGYLRVRRDIQDFTHRNKW